MRADVVAHLIAIVDPMASSFERDAAFRWWEDEVFDWRDGRGEVTADERFERQFLRAITEPFEERDGCGQIAVSYRVPMILRPPGLPVGRSEVLLG